MAPLALTLLGGFQARQGSGPALTLPTKKAQALLAYLALRPGQAHPRDKLAARLWGDASDAQARDSLRHTLAALRKALPATTLVTEGATVALNPAAVQVDVATFEQDVGTGTPEALERAVSLYQGDLLEGLAVSEPGFEEWLLAERERLRELALEALAKLLAHQSKAETTERAIQTAVRLLALDPLQEVVHRALMRLYARQGRRAAALRQYQVCLGILQRELGAEPEPETKQLYQEILRRRPSEVVTVGAAPEPAGGDAARRPARRTRAKREAGRVALRPALPMEDAPLIGRDLELGRLREALDAAGRGQGRVTMVVGEAGIGKSRLLLALGAEAERRGARVLVGRCYESEQILPFGPWVDAFRTGQVVTGEEVLGALEPVWRAELGRLLPEVEGPGLPPPSDDQRRLFESVSRLVERLAAVQPVALLLEDLHWADEMSARLLSFLGRRVQGWPVLVVASARAEELGDAPALRRVLQELGRERHFMELGLPPLSAEDTARLVRSLTRVGTNPAAVARLEAAIWRLSEGNPFVAVETVRALAEGTAPPETASLPLPERVREVIAGRLERLSDQSREAATVAAVIGREFEFALLQRAAGVTEGDAAEGVEELVRRRVLHGVGEGFDFTHDRIRKVAYSGLLPPRRKLLHAQVARALEELYAQSLEPHYAAVGRHYREAEVWEKAVIYLRQAGAQAVARSANRDAVACFEQALKALMQLPESRDRDAQAIDLRLDLRTSLVPLGLLEQVLNHLREDETLAEALDDHVGWGGCVLTSGATTGEPRPRTKPSHMDGAPRPSRQISRTSPSRSRRISTWARPTTPWATIVRHWTSSGGTWNRWKAT